MNSSVRSAKNFTGSYFHIDLKKIGKNWKQFQKLLKCKKLVDMLNPGSRLDQKIN